MPALVFVVPLVLALLAGSVWCALVIARLARGESRPASPPARVATGSGPARAAR